MIVGSAIARHASAKPDDVALVFDGETISWSELEALIGKAASWIESADTRGKSVALLLPNCPALAVFFLAAVRLGREAQIFDVQWPRMHVETILQQLSPDLSIADEASTPARETIALPHAALRFDGLKTWLADGRTLTDWPRVDPSAPFYVGFTSGSTGLPKGYRRNHRSWIASFEAAREEFGVGENDVVAAPGTLTHSLYLFALAYAMHEGATCLLSRGFKPSAVMADISQHAATVLFGVPAQLGMISRHLADRSETKLPALRWLISSGSKWSSRNDPTLRATFPNALFAEFYGASETSFISVARDDEEAPGRSVGRAFPSVRISIRDDDGNLCAAGEDGRIFVSSDMLFGGYATPAKDIARYSDGAIGVGDIGHLDANGFLFLTGRESRMIVTSGKNLFPEEVEQILERHPAIERAAVVAIADAKRGEKLLAIVKLRENFKTVRPDLIAFVRARLPLFKTPRDYRVASAWPLTRSGKTDFANLAKMLQNNELERMP